VVVIGGSAGIGLETARLAREEGADLILTARDPDRLNRVGQELGASSIAAFDATDLKQLSTFSTSCRPRSTTCCSRVPAPTTRR
jgi:NADP-dependent 3-hydroxy acid dehydrogenase YdfG